jgi:hypothetical protein
VLREVPFTSPLGWSAGDTIRIGFGIWLNLFILMLGTIISSIVFGVMVAGTASPAEDPDLSALMGNSSPFPKLDSGIAFLSLFVSAAVWAPFFAWAVGNTIRLIGDGIHHRRGSLFGYPEQI